jgi:hypothetical protein
MKSNSLAQCHLAAFNRVATGAVGPQRVRRLVLLSSLCLVAPLAAQTGATAIVRHAPSLNGTVEGSVQQMSAEALTLNGAAVVTQDLLVPGAPSIRLNGHPSYAGTVDGAGNAAPANYQITLNGNASLGTWFAARIRPLCRASPHRRSRRARAPS